MTDPVLSDKRITKGCVALDDHGCLFVVCNWHPQHWSGVSFNGGVVRANTAVFVAPNINTYIIDTYDN